MATYKPISNTVPQYHVSGEPASGYYLKGYKAGTTTALSMATDSTGATTLAKCQINSAGYPINGSSAVFIPHYNQNYKLVLYTNSTDADADTTGNAVWVVDNLSFNEAGSEWLDQTHTPTRLTNTTFELAAADGDQTAVYHVGRRVKLTDSSTLYAIITAVDYNVTSASKTHVTVDIDSGNLSASLSAVAVGILSATNQSANALGVTFLQSGTGAATTTVQAKLREFVSVKDYGAVGDGTTDDYAAFAAAIAVENHIYVPKGVYYLSQKLSTTTSEGDAVKIEGAGMSQCILAFKGTGGVKLANTGSIICDLTIIDSNSYTTPVTTLALFHSQLPQSGSVTNGTVGLELARNNTRADNMQVMGFDEGILCNETKFYMSLFHCRAHYNNTGFVSGDGVTTPNFCRSIGCYYSSNFEKNADIISGFHHFQDTSFELCAAYDNDNTNYPNGGIHVRAAGHAVFDHPYIEESNFYNASRKTVIRDVGNMWNAVFFAPTRVQSSQWGDKSKNLILPPYRRTWTNQAAGGVTIDIADTNLDSDKRYTRLTAVGDGSTAKVVRSHWNKNIRGLKPLSTANIDFKVYVGMWVKIVSGTFSTGYPFFRLQMEDTTAALFYAETPTRTMVHASNAFDNTASGSWQYVGAYFAVRNTFATGVALNRLRLELSVEDTTTDCSSVNRVIDISEPEIRLIYTTQGHEMMDREPDQESVEELTIASGVVSVVDHYHTVDTESDAASDDLDTINGQGLHPGFLLVVQAANSARTVVLKDGTGNLKLTGDITLDNTEDTATLLYTGSAWVEISSANNGA